MREAPESFSARGFADALQTLESLRGHPVVVYHSAIEAATVPRMFDCLQTIGRCKRLGLVLSTTGGSVTTAHRLATLLYDFASELVIFVPYQAWSAGSLLSLSATELVMGRLGELSPIDASLRAGNAPAETSTEVSAEDITNFLAMAESWFHIKPDATGLELLALMTQRVFPPSLARLYRSHLLVEELAVELLDHNLPHVGREDRLRIVKQLAGAYHAHDRLLTYEDVKKLGLRVTLAGDEEEAVLWSVASAGWIADERIDEHLGRELRSLIAGGEYMARQVRSESEGGRIEWSWHIGTTRRQTTARRTDGAC